MTTDLPVDLQTALGAGYTIERELGGGGMARVFVARDSRLGRRVVVKVLAPDLAAGLSAQRFEREVRLAARLQHPHVVPLLSAGEVGGLPYYTMPFVEGETLRARLLREGALPVPDTVRLVRELADALAYAHNEGVVHRDLKPENVLLSHGHAVVADFGVAKALASATQGAPGAAGGTQTTVGMAVGTPAYMAPEQALGDPATDHRADLYALGVVTYEMLAGQAPFAGRSAQALLAAHAVEAPAPVERMRADVPDALADLVARCLEKDPAARPRDAGEVLRMLGDPALASLASSVPGLRRAERAPSGRAAGGARRAVRRGIAATGALLAAAAVTLYATARTRPAPQENRLVVATFAGGAGVPADVGRATADYVAQRAGEVEGLTVVSRDETLRAEGRDATSGSAARAERQEVARRLGAGLLLTGALRRVHDSLVVEVTLRNGITGHTVRAIRMEPASSEDLAGRLDLLGERTSGALAMLTDPTFGRGMLPAGDPPRLGAVRELKEALETQAALRAPALDAGDAASELVHFDRAVAGDPAFLQARLWFVSAALRRFGGEAVADSALALVAAQRDRLTPFERALYDALHADAGGNHELAAQAWRRAAAAAPAWPVRWWLANKLRDANRPLEALAVYDSLGMTQPHFRRSLPPIYHYLGRHADELATLRAEAGRTPSVAQTLGWREATLQALAGLDSVGALGQQIDAAMSLPGEGGTSVAYLLSRAAWEFTAHGHPDAGRELTRRAAAWCGGRTRRDFENAPLLLDCVEAYAYAGDWSRAWRIGREALGRDPGDVAVAGVLGYAAAARGERALADSVWRLAVTDARSERSRGLPQWMAARLLAASGRRDEAVALLREAFARGAPWGFRLDLHRDPAFAPLRAYPPFLELMTPRG